MKELRPAKAVGIVETDLNVDFDAPVGYDPAAAASAERGGAENEGTTGAAGSPSSMDLPAPATGGGRKRRLWFQDLEMDRLGHCMLQSGYMLAIV